MYLGHDLDLLRSRDVTGHMTIGFPIPLFYSCPIVAKQPSPALFEILGPKDKLGHDLDLSRSRDVIGHMTIGFPISPFLFVRHCDQAPISSPF